jgi:hemoglobin-like flavoprotein
MTQRQLIRESAEVIHEMPQAIAQLFYGRLFDLDPSLRSMFKTGMQAQSGKLMDTLRMAVDSLDRFDQLRTPLRDLGRKHAVEHGVKPEHYKLVIESLLWAFGQAMHPYFYPETKAAWKILLEDISREMLAGASQ